MATKEETFEQLIELQHLMGAAHHQHMMQHGPMADATRGKGRVLALLKMKDGLATKDMANVLGIRVSSLNETLSRLEADGIVERRPSEQDGRIMLVYLTEKGRAEEQPQNDLPEMLFVDFQEAELDTLKGYLRRMSTALEERLGADWREHMHHVRHRREQIFHQAAGFGEGGPHEGRRPHEGRGRGMGRHGMHGHGGEGHLRMDARYPREAVSGTNPEPCDHNCRACTRVVCVRRMG